MVIVRRIFMTLFFIVFSFQCFYSMKTKSPVTDTISFHAVNGYVYLKSHDFRMSPATPPLMREWVALPWLFLNPKVDYSVSSWREADSVPFSTKFFYQDHRDKAEWMLMASRIMTWLIAVALFFLVKIWSNQLYGAFGAFIASSLYLGSPTIIGYSSVVNIDIAIAFFYTLTCYCVWRQWGAMKVTGNFPWKVILAFAGALATKYTGILLAPLILIFAVLRRGLFRGFLTAILIGVLALGAVWMTYFFEFKPLLKDVPRIEEKEGYIRSISDALSFKNKAIRELSLKAAHHWPIPLPSWILGFAGITRSHQDDYRHYFMGQWRQVQVPYHYFVSFGTKATLPVLILLFIRMLALMKTLTQKRRYEEFVSLCLLTAPVILFTMTWFDTTGVGIRYLIPVFPLFFIWIAGLVSQKSQLLKKFLILMVLVHIATGISAFPNHLAYFNPLIGGSQNAYKIFRANDLEWGQELKNLAVWTKKNDIQEIKTYLFGTRDEFFYGLNSSEFTKADLLAPEKKVYAISVFWLDTVPWTKEYVPITKIGHTIWVYDFRNTGEIQGRGS